MFWGLIMEPGRCYTQQVKVSFHVSMAALDITNADDKPAQVMCVFEDRNYLLCTLNKKDHPQVPLDLNFEAGSKVSFAANGNAHVHLSGYLTEYDELGDEEEEVEDEDDDEEVEDEQEVEDKKTKGKRKKINNKPEPSKKKTKTEASISALLNGDEETDSSDSDFNISEVVESDDEELVEEEEEEGDEDVEEEEEDDEDEEDEDEEEEEEEEVEQQPRTKKLNGTAPKKVSNDKTAKDQKNKQQQKKPKKSVLKGGIIIEELKEGTGEAAKPGKYVHVYYEGRLKNTNKVFDSATKGAGFGFKLGKNEVIKGWDIGLVGMRLGGKRRVICPPQMAYGAKGSPPVIPPNSTLVFDVELKKIS